MSYNNLPSELKRTENFKVFKNNFKSYLLQNCFYSLRDFFLVIMIDASLVIWVSFDMIRKYIGGLWTIIFTKRVILCFPWLTCVFGGLSIIIVLYWIAWSCHSWLISYSKVILIKKGFYFTLSCIFFKSCWHVVFGCYHLTCPIVPV
jgi:hypothetical protein